MHGLCPLVGSVTRTVGEIRGEQAQWVKLPFFIETSMNQGPAEPDAVVRGGLSQRANDRPVGFLGKSLKRDGAQIAL